MSEHSAMTVNESLFVSGLMEHVMINEFLEIHEAGRSEPVSFTSVHGTR
jgi:hypothetical protein